jgi:hypothetical protein
MPPEARPHPEPEREELVKEAHRIEEDTQHSGAQHFAAGQRWRGRAFWLGLPATVAVAATSTAAGLSALVGTATWVTALMAFTVAVAVAVAARDFIGADRKATAHSSKGARYFAVRDDARRFANIEARTSKSIEAATDRLNAIAERQKALRSEEPLEVDADLRDKVRKGIDGGDYIHTVDRT